MEKQILTKAPQLAARLHELDSAIAGLPVERFRVLAEIRAIDEAEGKSESQTDAMIAQLSRSSPRIASGDVRLASKVASLPEVAEAFRTGAISKWQLDAVGYDRGKLAEERQKLQKERFLSFTKHGDQTTIRGSLPHLEGSQMEKQRQWLILKKNCFREHRENKRIYLARMVRTTPSTRPTCIAPTR
jgi:hypothetical protein